MQLQLNETAKKPGKTPRPASNPSPIVRELFDAIDSSMLTRKEVFQVAGYEDLAISKYATGERRMHVQTLADIAQVMGFKLELVPIEE